MQSKIIYKYKIENKIALFRTIKNYIEKHISRHSGHRIVHALVFPVWGCVPSVLHVFLHLEWHIHSFKNEIKINVSKFLQFQKLLYKGHVTEWHDFPDLHGWWSNLYFQEPQRVAGLTFWSASFYCISRPELKQIEMLNQYTRVQNIVQSNITPTILLIYIYVIWTRRF